MTTPENDAQPRVEQTGTEPNWSRQEAILRRAYEISLTTEGATPEDNWLRAEAELSRQQPPFP